MWDVVERAQVAARPGRVWQVVSEVLDVDAATGDRRRRRREATWVARETVGDVDLEVRWWLRVAPSWNGTEVEYGASAEGDDIGTASARDALSARLVATLRDIKARAEVSR